MGLLSWIGQNATPLGAITGAVGTVGNILSNINSTNAAKQINSQNIEFQKEQNAIERARADSTLQRTVEDAHKAGLSAFGQNPVPLGDTVAPELDMSPAQSLNNLGSAFGQMANFGLDTLSYLNEKGRLNKDVKKDTHDMDVADREFELKKTMEFADLELKRIDSDLKSQANLREEEKKGAELQRLIAERLYTEAQTDSVRNSITLSKNKDSRENENHNLYMMKSGYELDMLSNEVKMSLLELSYAEFSDLYNKKLVKLSYETSQKELELLMQELKLNPKKVNAQAFRDVMLGLAGVLKTGGDVISSATRNKIGF